jgi:hypothetical protein
VNEKRFVGENLSFVAGGGDNNEEGRNCDKWD